MLENHDQRLKVSLLAMRLGIFIVMLMWTLDKFVQPEHAAGVFSNFYGLNWSGILMTGAAVLEMVLVLAFVAGVFRRLSYGLVLVLHGISTFSSFSQYLDPFNHLLFFAAWPMLAACLALYLLRENDTLFSVDAMRAQD